jgi:hypothetical protein
LNFPEGWFVSGYDLGALGLIAFGELAACFKATIPFAFWRLRGEPLFLRLGLRGVWTVWLMYAWCADALTVISMPALTDSLPHLIFIVAAFCALELSGALMPAIAWTIKGETSAAQINRAVTSEASNSPAAEQQSATPFRDLALLLEHVTTQGAAGLEGVRIDPDGTIITTQGVLAKLLNSSKGTVNRQLRELKTAGRIMLTTTRNGTRIKLCSADVNSQPCFSHDKDMSIAADSDGETDDGP